MLVTNEGFMSNTKTAIPSRACRYEAVVIGGSAGGYKAVCAILAVLPASFNLPLLLVQHLHPDDAGSFARQLATATSLPVIEPCDKEPIQPGHLYVAPAGYHMLVEQSGTIALSTEEKVNWSRPAIDPLFESAALAWDGRVIAVILSGANSDGVAGIRAIKEAGGLTIAQAPATADYPLMPQAAIDSKAVDEVLTVAEIGLRISDFRMPNADLT